MAERPTRTRTRPRPDGRAVVAVDEVPKVRRYLLFFRVMATVVGLGLLLLCVHLILDRGFSNDALRWWVIPHGYVYIVYLVAVVLLGFTVRWSLPRMVAVMLAGVVPFLSFVVESRRAREVTGAIARAVGESGGSAGRVGPDPSGPGA